MSTATTRQYRPDLGIERRVDVTRVDGTVGQAGGRVVADQGAGHNDGDGGHDGRQIRPMSRSLSSMVATADSSSSTVMGLPSSPSGAGGAGFSRALLRRSVKLGRCRARRRRRHVVVAVGHRRRLPRPAETPAIRSDAPPGRTAVSLCAWQHARKPQPLDLRTIWLFSGCTASELRTIRSSLDELTVPPGKVLVEEGAIGREFFIIVSGKAVVRRGGQKIATLGPGAYFGELALLDRRPRSATVVSETELSLLRAGPAAVHRHPGQGAEHRPQAARRHGVQAARSGRKGVPLILGGSVAVG